jgi:hypothetical protein
MSTRYSNRQDLPKKVASSFCADIRKRFILTIKLMVIIFWASHDLIIGPDGRHKWQTAEEREKIATNYTVDPLGFGNRI